MPTPPTQYKLLTQFLSQFSILQHTPGSTIIASQTNTYLIRDIELTRTPNTQSNEQFNEIINTLCQHQTLKSRNILGLIDFQIIFNKTKTQSQIRAVYEYGRKSLFKEIEDRKATDEYFDEEALWGLVYSITSPLAYLQEKNIIYGVIDSTRIFLDNNLIAVLDPSSTGIDPYEIIPNRLYSPELLCPQRSLQEINMFKSDVYVLGLIMLQCSLLKMDLYQYDSNIIQMCLSEIKDIYSENLSQLIEAMLDEDPDNRPSFEEVLKMIGDLFEISTTEVETLQPMMPDDQNEGNQICMLDEHSEREVIDILETEYIRYEDQRYEMGNFDKQMQHKFATSKRSYFSESMIEEASQYSEASSISLDQPFEKLLEKSNARINKPRQIKQKLVKTEYEAHSSRDNQPTNAILFSQSRTKSLHSQISVIPQEKQQQTHKNKKSMSLKQQNFKQSQIRQKQQSKQNQLPQNSFNYPVVFSPLNKDNLFTKPEIMNMIKNDIKKIQDKKRSGLSVHFNYFSGDEGNKHLRTSSLHQGIMNSAKRR